MQDEISDYFQCPRDKIDTIPNGVETTRSDRLEEQDLSRFRNVYALPAEKMVFSVGRVVFEKGLQVLVRAMPIILAQQPAVKVVIAGKGSELESLRSTAWKLGVGEGAQSLSGQLSSGKTSQPTI